MINYLEQKLTLLMIKTLKEGYGPRCADYCDDCATCRANRCVAFLLDHIDLLKWGKEPWFINPMKKYDRRNKK